jgi:hypothetical protein
MSDSDLIFMLGLLTAMMVVWSLLVQSGGGTNGKDKDN